MNTDFGKVRKKYVQLWNLHSINFMWSWKIHLGSNNKYDGRSNHKCQIKGIQRKKIEEEIHGGVNDIVICIYMCGKPISTAYGHGG